MHLFLRIRNLCEYSKKNFTLGSFHARLFSHHTVLSYKGKKRKGSIKESFMSSVPGDYMKQPHIIQLRKFNFNSWKLHRYSSQVQVEMFKLQSVICLVIVNLVFGANLNVSVMTSFILALIMLMMNMICKGNFIIKRNF